MPADENSCWTDSQRELKPGDRVRIIYDQMFPEYVGRYATVTSVEPCIAVGSCWIYVHTDGVPDRYVTPRSIWRGPYTNSYLAINGHTRNLQKVPDVQVID